MRRAANNLAGRLAWFAEGRFGLFIHWGLYALPGRGEWVLLQERIPNEEYAALAWRFRPDAWQADRWVELAQRAGTKYMVLTTRHHDGFCLFDSRVSDYTAVKTGARRDLVGEFVAACRRAGMRVGFYYSLLDWRLPAWNRGPQQDPTGWAALVHQAHEQVRELCSNYGTVDLLWYDGMTFTAADWQSDKLNAMVRRLQPDIVINNRAGVPEDFDTPEQHTTPSSPGRLWESCMTIGEYSGWGYIRHNPNLRTVTQLLQHLVYSASEGGNYLLNVGPKADGTIERAFTSRLEAMGKWLAVNGDSVYGTTRCPFGAASIGVTTCKGSTAYVHAFRWPGDTAVLVGVGNRVQAARVLATGQPARVEQHGDRVILRGLPARPPDRHDSVISLELDGPAREA